MSEGVNPLEYKFTDTKEYDENKLMEMPGMELHLGKMSWSGDTGEKLRP